MSAEVTNVQTFEATLAQVVTAHVAGCSALLKVERLSGGASQETYRLTVEKDGIEMPLAMRRTPGGEYLEPLPAHPGLDVEARLMQAAKAVGVPEPEVYHVLTRADGLGDGFIMEWIDGEALGARITRDAQFESIRPTLAKECGRILAQIHSIDLDASGLRTRLAEMTPKQFLA
ncbi:MAG: phosphotransferase, partial [Pseudomonadales bacterium]